MSGGATSSMMTHMTEAAQQDAGGEAQGLAPAAEAPPRRFKPLNMSCDSGCYVRGNCNVELGRCDCPFGFKGGFKGGTCFFLSVERYTNKCPPPHRADGAGCCRGRRCV